ncbi:hypothetical protein VKT23_010308 [Stygiomarasmius scandens]|uniref:FAD-binding domain-containing protein n=1 Tax=Marasmiellus scandens TaxID=2682957 RepID=A0ABR1JC83_9AGAR
MAPQLPTETKVLIVGAGPTGLATAISLLKHGLSPKDMVIVDNVLTGDNSSRALTIHAATLEALETIDCADTIRSLGTGTEAIRIRDRKATDLFSGDFSYLSSYTKYPFTIVLSQKFTEKVLHDHLESLSVHIIRPVKAVGLKVNDQGHAGLDVSFESGEVITAQYVVAADGSRSVIRQTAGIGFADPDGLDASVSVDPHTSQIVLADVSFSENIEHIFPTNPSGVSFGISPGGFFLTVPQGRQKASTKAYDTEDPVYRIGFSMPVAAGPPPSHPPAEFLQKYINSQGPLGISSDPTQNPTGRPVRLNTVHWSTRFRTHSAIADIFFKRLGDGQSGGVVMLVGDAAHIHSPAGGQGMNLELRDAVGLGSVLAKHIKESKHTGSNDADGLLRDFATDRRNRGLKQISLTKWLMYLITTMMNPYSVQYWFYYFVGMFPFMKRSLVWSMSGLGNR